MISLKVISGTGITTMNRQEEERGASSYLSLPHTIQCIPALRRLINEGNGVKLRK